jgi:anti-sigma regulatory factor (Ser/Thr protein kinase)
MNVRSAEITLEPHPASVGRARRWVSRQLEEWGLDDLDYDVSVVLSELVTNAVLHAKTEIELRASYDGSLRIEVCDWSATMPSIRGHVASSTTGRGLHLVAALASSWGYEARSPGKAVWAEFSDAGGSRRPGPLGASGTPTAGIRVLDPHRDLRSLGPGVASQGKSA